MNTLWTLPVFPDEKQSHIARALHILLRTTVLLSTLLLAVAVTLNQRFPTVRETTVVGLVYMFCPVLAYLNIKGRTRTASIAFIVVFTILITVNLFMTADVNASAFYWYTVVAYTAGYLLNGKAGIVSAVVCSLLALGLVVLDQWGWLPAVTATHTAIDRWIIFTSFTAVIVSLQFLTSNSITHALRRTQQQLDERRLVEETLRQSEERYRILAENSSDVIWQLDAAYRFTYVSPADEQMRGFPKHETVGRELWSILKPEAAEAMKQQNARRLLDECRGIKTGTQRYEIEVRRKDGRWMWAEITVSAFRGKNGELDGYHGMTRDITERKKTQEALLLQDAAMQSAANSIVITDKSGTILSVNKAFTQITGYTREEAIGRKPSFLKSGKHTEECYRDLWKTILDGKVWKGEFENRRKDGGLYIEETTITPVCREHNVITHFISIKQDVTEQRRLQKEFLQTQKLQSLGTLAGGIAHDFNNLLAMILASAEMLKRKMLDPAAVAKYAEQIIIASGRGASISRQLLVYSRPDQAELKPISIPDIVAEVKEMLSHFLAKTITIETSIVDTDGMIMGDSGHLHQAILNLAINAGDAMGNNGQLTVTVFPVQAEDIRKKFIYDGTTSFVAVAVADTGRGINPATLEKIFDPFFSTKEKGKGTGLGLSIVHSIVKNHNGFVDVASIEGQGTTFTMYFPCLNANVLSD